MYVCENDRYCPTADTFETMDAFLEMCRGCFGEAPTLREVGDEYVDEHGDVALRLVAQRPTTTVTATVSFSEQPGVTYYVEMSRDGAEADYYDGNGWDDAPAGETVDAWMDYAQRRIELPTAVARAGLDWTDASVDAVGWSQGPGHAPTGIRLTWSW